MSWSKVGKADATIPGLVGNAPGCGQVNIWERSGDPEGEDGGWRDSAEKETAYNFSGVAIEPGRFLHLAKHSGSGCWLIVAESYADGD